MKALIPALVLIAALWMASNISSAVAQTCPPGHPRVAPDSRYSDHGDGTVTDLQTGLMWKRCSEGQSGTACSGTESIQTWQAALTTAANSSFAGYSDWRLPSVKELQSLVETGCHSPSINGVRFPNTPSNSFWTSTTVASNASNARVVNFSSGNVNGSVKSGNLGVRLVRAGQ
jgi:hypothetical protein